MVPVEDRRRLTLACRASPGETRRSPKAMPACFPQRHAGRTGSQAVAEGLALARKGVVPLASIALMKKENSSP